MGTTIILQITFFGFLLGLFLVLYLAIRLDRMALRLKRIEANGKRAADAAEKLAEFFDGRNVKIDRPAA